MLATKQEFNEVLKNNMCRVFFTKKDGSERMMNCTLMSDVLESDQTLATKGNGSVVPDYQIRCVDVDIMEWRSFNIESVLKFEVV